MIAHWDYALTGIHNMLVSAFSRLFPGMDLPAPLAPLRDDWLLDLVERHAKDRESQDADTKVLMELFARK